MLAVCQNGAASTCERRDDTAVWSRCSLRNQKSLEITANAEIACARASRRKGRLVPSGSPFPCVENRSWLRAPHDLTHEPCSTEVRAWPRMRRAKRAVPRAFYELAHNPPSLHVPLPTSRERAFVAHLLGAQAVAVRDRRHPGVARRERYGSRRTNAASELETSARNTDGVGCTGTSAPSCTAQIATAAPAGVVSALRRSAPRRSR